MKKTVLLLVTLILLSVNVLAQQTCGTVKDIDGNVYATVQIGSQCWMAENLKTMHYADGTSIPMGHEMCETKPYRFIPDMDYSMQEAFVSLCGYLYNWPAVMHNSSSYEYKSGGVQGICPNGWHVPSDAEWTKLENYVGGQNRYLCDGNSKNIAKALAFADGWESSAVSCSVGNDQSANGATGFGALPAGGYYGRYGNFGYIAYFWSATETGSISARYRSLDSHSAEVYRGNYSKGGLFSVRCVRD